MSCEICFMVDDDFRQHCTQDALLQLYWCFRVIPQRHQILTQRCQLLLLRFTKRLGRLSRSRKARFGLCHPRQRSVPSNFQFTRH